MIWVTVFDVLVLKFVSPLYTALIECEPTLKLLVVNDALPLVSVCVPSEVVPSKNCTLPPMVPAVALETVAVTVTAAPYAAGLTLDANVVLVVAVLAVVVCVIGVAALKLASP